MYQFEITDNEAGQRLDKYLSKLLPKAPSSFFYKMLRKKNIVLNNARAQGPEKLAAGDQVRLFLSAETFSGFSQESRGEEYRRAYESLSPIEVVYENEHLLLADKPAGVLSQKAKDSDLSLNEWLIGLLLARGDATKESLATFRPSVCNRLDRNTSGLVICSKSLAGSQRLNELIRMRKIRKFYRLFVSGDVTQTRLLTGYLVKDAKTNRVRITSKKTEGSSYVETRYYPVERFSDITYLEAELITGKTHQIRAHMALDGHPLLGDVKYGDAALHDRYRKKYHLDSQLLHAFRLEFPPDEILFPGRKRPSVFTAEEPAVFTQILADQREG